MADAMPLLHGTLDATIFEAKFNNSNQVSKFLQGLVPHIEGRPTGLPQMYATVDLNNARVGRTRIDDSNPDNPRWNESFHIYCAHYSTDVVFSIKARLPIDAVLIGRAYLPVQDLLSLTPKDQDIDRWLDVLDEHKKPLPHGPKIHVRARFKNVAVDPSFGRGVGGAQYAGVPGTFFKQRQGCRVTLYQDAHVLDTFRPDIHLAGGRAYEPRRCWEDVYDAIDGARHFVYVTGWSVYAEITLVRDGSRKHPGGGTTLGELLKRKAKEGVRVLMLVWDDPTSLLNLGILPSQLGTNDAQTFNYFRGTGVHCVPCPRHLDDSEYPIEFRKTVALSHHQKTVIVDAEDGGGGSGLRRVVSFVGGIDLTNGRYDTQSHSLFRTLNTAHSNDFYQNNIDGASINKGGPREPWHDIHCRIEGPAAWDVLHNFEQRWRKQGGKDDILHNVLWPWKNKGDLLVDLKGMENVIAPQSSPAVADSDQEAWNVQVFRSIDGSACSGFPKTPQEAAQSGLISGKNHVIDRSIQDAYIHAIRRAKRFIYIENQYFLGSSFAWKPDGIKPEDIGAVQLVPRELSLKIVSKIEAGEPFAVYIVVPMWPEGVPTAWNIQAMLSWQSRTMEMMYTDISKALKAKNIDANPKDYLSFFCLGNREVKVPGEYEPKRHPTPGTDYDRAQKARRSMIYVHSKLMIVDDEYIIIGSANINQRSMDGARDSEIAMGAYQPSHLNTNGDVATGLVHGLRMSLWYEHLGELQEEFQDPGTLKCVQMVNKRAEEFWKIYTSDNLEDNLHGHLLSYPIDVTNDGMVTERKGVKFFPDTEAPVLGTVPLHVQLGSPFTDYVFTT
ncbi:phospholipase D alpha 2-like [Miscanthus floridulus]|uniref:phospholipase D alpha 2-like n=1 Tax=Miscanthus floridulus TaxID=154761 RepID=UPI003458E8E0